jgi:hypothetical protein
LIYDKIDIYYTNKFDVIRKGRVRMDIRQAVTSQELAQVSQLFRQYFVWLADEHGINMGYQSVEAELAGLPGYYTAPGGSLLLLFEAGEAAGWGGIPSFGWKNMRIEKDVCETRVPREGIWQSDRRPLAGRSDY